MTRYNFYNNLELFHKTKEIIQQEEQEKIQEDLNELKHYGTKGQKWGVRKWQNYDGTFNEAGKERYFGKSSKTTESDEDKVGSARSDVKDYLKFRNKMLKQRTRDDLNKWYRDNNKAADKQLLKDAKKVDKQREKMYKNQLKDFYDDPNELVSDLDRMYKIGSNEEKVGSLYSAGQKIKNLFPQKRIGENGEEYDARYQNHYGYLTEKGKRYLEKHPHDATGKLNMKLYADSIRRGAENDAEREKERLAREAKQKSDIEYINNLKSNIKTTKELKGEEISDKEFKDIIQELDNFDMRDFERNHKEDYNKVADIGIDALNKAEGGWVEDDIRDDGNREWFMWEDQTIGNPEIAYLYYKGYSKDYIKQYLNKTVPTEDYGKYTDEEDSVYGYPYSKGFFVKDEFHRGGNDYIDALFDKGEEDQKIGGFFNKTPEEKAEKEGKKLNYELNKADWSKRRDIINNLLKDEKYKDLLDEIAANDKKRSAEALDRTEEIFNDFDDEEIRNLAIAGITNMKEYGYFPNPTMEDLANNAWFYVYEDGNQGDNTAEYLYATMEKGVKGDELDNLYKKLHVKKDSLDEGVTTLKKNPILTNVNEKYLKEIVDRKLEQNESDNSSYWHLYAASEGSSNTPSDATKKNYKEAKDIVKKLDSSCGNGDGWDFLNQAIENLDMSSKELSSMTQADWDRINAEINKLKK